MNHLISNQEADEIGEEYARMIYSKSPNDSLCVDIDGLATEVLGLKVIYETFYGKDMDKEGFLADGSTAISITRNGQVSTVVFPWKTVVLDTELLKPEKSSRRRFTLAHEVAHYLIAVLFLQPFKACAHREFDSERDYSNRDLHELFCSKEYDADRLAAAILMPGFNVAKAMGRFSDNGKVYYYGSNILSTADKMRIQLMADCSGVSYQSMAIRLKELGYTETRPFREFVEQDLREGDFDDSDIPYDHSQGRLSPEQAYLIHRAQREVAELEQKPINCPACGFPMTTISRNSLGYSKYKCRKCKLESPLGLAYYRKKKR